MRRITFLGVFALLLAVLSVSFVPLLTEVRATTITTVRFFAVVLGLLVLPGHVWSFFFFSQKSISLLERALISVGFSFFCVVLSVVLTILASQKLSTGMVLTFIITLTLLPILVLFIQKVARKT